MNEIVLSNAWDESAKQFRTKKSFKMSAGMESLLQSAINQEELEALLKKLKKEGESALNPDTF